MYKYPMGQFGRMKMSHMISDSDNELHLMAARIGIARKWYQGDHYDVSISRRALAIAAGAVAIELTTLAHMACNRRFGWQMGTPETCMIIDDLCDYFDKNNIPIPSQLLLEGK